MLQLWRFRHNVMWCHHGRELIDQRWLHVVRGLFDIAWQERVHGKINKVRLSVRRYEEEGHMPIRSRPQGPIVSTPEEDQHIQSPAERAPLSTAVCIIRETGVHCQLITTRRWIRQTGRQCFISAHKEELTEAHRETAKGLLRCIRMWESIFGSLSILLVKNVSCVAAVYHQCWQLRDTRYARRHIHEKPTSGRVTTSIHGWMWWEVVGKLTHFEGHMVADQYINILEISFTNGVSIWHSRPTANIIIWCKVTVR